MGIIQDPSGPRDSWFRTVVAVVAFCIHLTAIGMWTGLTTPPKPGTDAHEYDVYAWNIAQGRGYRGLSVDVRDQDHLTAYRPPTAPLYYAAIYRLVGHRYAAAHIANCLLIAGTVLLLYAVTRRCFGQTAARIAAVLYAFYPMALYFNLALWSETLANFLIVLFVWCCLPIKEDRGFAWAAAAGVVFGALLLCKPGVVFLLPLFPVWAWIVCRDDKGLWLRALAVPVCAALVLAPWIIRNRIVMGAFIPFGTSGGQLLLSGNNRIVVEDPRLAGYSVMDNALPEFQAQLQAPDDEIQRDAVARRLALDWLWKNPDKWFYLLQGKFFREWAPHYYGVTQQELAPIVSGYYALVLVLFVAAVIPVTRRFVVTRDPAIVMQLLILALTGTALLFHGQHRYRFTTDPFCISLAGAALAWSVQMVRHREWGTAFGSMVQWTKHRRLAIGLSLLAGAALAVAWKADQDHMEAYRARVCEDKMQAIARAVHAYHEAEGYWPATLNDLVPRFLPNVDALHCPKHSVGWHDYQSLGCRQPEQATQLISYQIVQPGAASAPVQIEEVATEHFGSRHVLTIQP
jgi:4-amino-4-deoxy-L-arabinose transferase-like glycosyltransferase